MSGKGAPRIVVIDSYDSFVYNIVQYLGRSEEHTSELQSH